MKRSVLSEERYFPDVRLKHIIEEKKVGNTMPRWMLRCPRCDESFPQSEVTFTMFDPFGSIGIKPDFPNGGLSLECPHCKEASVYQRHQLVYSAS